MKIKVKSFGISYHNHIFFIIIFCISFFDDSEETATHTDEKDRENHLTKVTMSLATVTMTVKPSVINS